MVETVEYESHTDMNRGQLWTLVKNSKGNNVDEFSKEVLKSAKGYLDSKFKSMSNGFCNFLNKEIERMHEYLKKHDIFLEEVVVYEYFITGIRDSDGDDTEMNINLLCQRKDKEIKEFLRYEYLVNSFGKGKRIHKADWIDFNENLDIKKLK